MSQIIDRVLAGEIDVALVDGSRISVPDATPEKDVAALIECKAEIISRLQEAQALANECLRLAMLRCGQFHDGPQAREAMRADVLACPPRLLPGLLAHFRDVTGSGEASGGGSKVCGDQGLDRPPGRISMPAKLQSGVETPSPGEMEAE